MIIAGNKCDLKDKRRVKKNEASAFANKNSMDFFEVSARRDQAGENVDAIFATLTNILMVRTLSIISPVRYKVYIHKEVREWKR